MMSPSFGNSHIKTKFTTCSPQFYDDISQLYSKIYKCREQRLRLLKNYSSLLCPDYRRPTIDSQSNSTIQIHQQRIDDLERRLMQSEQRLRLLQMKLTNNPMFLDKHDWRQMGQSETPIRTTKLGKPDCMVNCHLDRIEEISKTLNRLKEELVPVSEERMSDIKHEPNKDGETNSQAQNNGVHCISPCSQSGFPALATQKIAHEASSTEPLIQSSKIPINKSSEKLVTTTNTIERCLSTNSTCISPLQDKSQIPSVVICEAHLNTYLNGNLDDSSRLIEKELVINDPAITKAPIQLKIFKTDSPPRGSPTKKNVENHPNSTENALPDEKPPSPKPRNHLSIHQQMTDSSSSIESPIPPTANAKPAMNYEAFLRQAASAEYSDGMQSDEREIELGEALLVPNETTAAPQRTAESVSQMSTKAAFFKPNFCEDDDEDDSFYD